MDSCINSATDRRGGYVLERMFTKFSEITGWTENAGPENKGPQKQDRKMEDKCNSGKLSQQRSALFKHCNGTTGPGHGMARIITELQHDVR